MVVLLAFNYLVIIRVLIGEGNDNLLQYYCLENPMGRETW